MKHYSILLGALVIGLLLIAGCSNEENPVIAPQASPRAALTAAAAVPADAVIDSARFYVFVSQTDSQTILVHEIIQGWNELEVTYSNFAAAYNPTSFASVPVTSAGWYPVNVTSQVQGWFDSTSVNYGFFLRPADTDTGSTSVISREAESNQPFLEVFYTTWEGLHCDTLDAAADAHIFSGSPDVNFGSAGNLLVGREIGVDSVYQTLIRFDFPVEIRYSTIGDRVWLDTNGDGIQDEGETGMADVTVNLYDCENNPVGTTVTDEAGMYSFGMIPAGNYFLEFVGPYGYRFSPMDIGDDDSLDSDADPMTGRTVCFVTLPGGQHLDFDAGLFAFEGCTYSKGYWKNHAGFGPQADVLSQLLPIWLGDSDGEKSMAVIDAQIAVDILSQDVYGHPRNGITKLYAQLLAAKLNIANFANPADIHEVVEAADAFLAGHDWMGWDMLAKEDQQMVLGWKDMLDQYNNGLIGPGHCDDGDDIDDDDSDDGADDDSDDVPEMR